MKILVTNLAGIKKENGEIKHFAKAGSRWPMIIGKTKTVDYYPFPFWLAYTSSLLKRDTPFKIKGLDGVVLDLDAKSYLDLVKDFKPDILITELTTISIKDDLEILKTVKKETKTKVVLAGNFPTVKDYQLLRLEFIDYILRGEYEITAKELIIALYEKGPLENVEGLSYKIKNKIFRNKERPLLKNLDELPFPDREDFPATLYPDFTIYSPSISLIASRGCPANCVYCQERHILYASPLYRKRDPKKVVDEMIYCKEKFGARQFYFDDQSFVVDKNYTKAICEEIIKRNLKVPWTCMGDAMFTDEETIDLMAKAGCIGMKFGVETSNQRILKIIGKPLNPEKAKEVVKWCKKRKIRTHATFMIGLPTMRKKDVLNDMKYLKELKPTTAQVAIATPYPGTPFYKWAKKNNYLITFDLSKYNGQGEAVISYPYFKKDEIELLYKIFLKKVSRGKLIQFLLSPISSFSIMKELLKRKGLKSLINSIFTVIKRTI